jgi:hypothetical protein
VQNKLHWAIHGQTAAEVVYHRIVQDRLFESDFDRLVQQAGLGASSVDDGV